MPIAAARYASSKVDKSGRSSPMAQKVRKWMFHTRITFRDNAIFGYLIGLFGGNLMPP